MIERAEIYTGRSGAAAAFPRAGERPALVVRLIDRHGCWGQGEASPLPGHSLESFETAAGELRRWCRDAIPAPLPEDAPFESTVGDLIAPVATSAARFALETALADLAARRAGTQVSRLLGGAGERRPLPVNALLPPEAKADVLARAVQRGLDEGITTFKAKIARAPRLADEIDALSALRDAFEHRFALRLDVNGAWTLDAARRHLTRLAPLEPEYVEQPVGRRELLELRDPPVPLAADESLQSREIATRLIAGGVIAAVVVKPAAVGGLIRARRLAADAAARGLTVVVTHLMDGPIGAAAAAELALSLEPGPAACGLAPHAGLAAWDATAPQLGGAYVRPHRGTGLGLPPLEPPR